MNTPPEIPQPEVSAATEWLSPRVLRTAVAIELVAAAALIAYGLGNAVASNWPESGDSAALQMYEHSPGQHDPQLGQQLRKNVHDVQQNESAGLESEVLGAVVGIGVLSTGAWAVRRGRKRKSA